MIEVAIIISVGALIVGVLGIWIVAAELSNINNTLKRIAKK
jgi:hypothetical protein